MTSSIKTNLQNIVDSISLFENSLTNEEITKQSLVLPFISALGYNVFSPFDVQAELSCDILKPKGEKVDYAIMHNNNPAIIIECKKYNEPLNAHQAQLARYFAATNANFAILTNGTDYLFFSDIENQNLMDSTPFFTFNIKEISDTQLTILEQFSKSSFDTDTINDTANSLKTFSSIKNTLIDYLNTPSPELVKLICKEIHNGRFTDSVINNYTSTFKNAWNSIKNDIIENNLNIIIKQKEQNTNNNNPNITSNNNNTTNKKEIITTDKEIEALHYIKAIASNITDSKRITMQDGLNACNICLDNQRYSIAHLLFNNENKLKIEINNTKYPIDNTEDILLFKNEILTQLNKLLEQ